MIVLVLGNGERVEVAGRLEHELAEYRSARLVDGAVRFLLVRPARYVVHLEPGQLVEDLLGPHAELEVDGHFLAGATVSLDGGRLVVEYAPVR